MTQSPIPPAVLLVPETAPCTPEQRSWLNGFLAGLVSLDGSGVTALSPEQSAALMPNSAPKGPLDDGDPGDAPWHDQTLPIVERMTLADKRPLRRRMMAAMAQQDCGQCGYNCEDYSDKIATVPLRKEEERLEPLCPGWQRNRAHAQDARGPEIGGRELAGSIAVFAGGGQDNDAECRCYGCAALHRPIRRRLAQTREKPADATFVSRSETQQSGFGKRHLPRRNRSPPQAASTMPSAMLFGLLSRAT